MKLLIFITLLFTFHAKASDIHDLVYGQKFEELKKLLDSNKTDINVQDESGLTALHIASFNGDLKSVNLLLSQGADWSLAHKRGLTALHLAVYNKKIDTLKVLLKAGSNVEAKDQDGITALQHAVFTKQLKAVDLLIQNGADINAQNKMGWTPLHSLMIFPSDKESSDILELFLKQPGLKINLGVQGGFSPLSIGEDSNTGRLYRVKMSSEPMKQRPVVFAEEGSTSLHLMVRAKHSKEHILKLLKKGANINAQTKKGNTALHIASNKGYKDIVNLLIKEGAKLDIENRKGQKAIDLARGQGEHRLVKLLQQVDLKKNNRGVSSTDRK